eukprot:TRINITY_DN4211_c0_g4_i3.p2 TRINITY_DN4211_c0_g4~~TRINITY_DN4211_c0_g4_i3.p2  ORF type:complete len:127 (-),score=32.54 TRINITY_DN4211_c0_g4_i3:672-1052(-)
MEITPDLVSWPTTQFEVNIEDNLEARYDIEILQSFPTTAEVLAVLKASDAKLQDDTKVLILYQHEGKGLEGIIEVEKIALQNDFFLAWEFFTTVASRSSPDSKKQRQIWRLFPKQRLDLQHMHALQ